MWSVIESVYHSLYIYFSEFRDSLLKDFHTGVLGPNTQELVSEKNVLGHIISWYKSL